MITLYTTSKNFKKRIRILRYRQKCFILKILSQFFEMFCFQTEEMEILNLLTFDFIKLYGIQVANFYVLIQIILDDKRHYELSLIYNTPKCKIIHKIDINKTISYYKNNDINNYFLNIQINNVKNIIFIVNIYFATPNTFSCIRCLYYYYALL